MNHHRKDQIARAFGAAAPDYAQHAGPQSLAAELVAQLAAQCPTGARPTILEIGCGTGLLTRHIRSRWPDADLTVTDIAPAMVATAAQDPALAARMLVMDGEYPPFDGQHFDLILSSLAFQWFDDLSVAITRLHALLRPGGSLIFSTMAAGSFDTWRAAHLACGVAPGVPDYPSLAMVQAMLEGYPDAFAFDEIYPLAGGGAKALVKHLRGIGAIVPVPGRAPLTAGHMRKVMAHFDAAGGEDAYSVAFARITRV